MRRVVVSAGGPVEEIGCLQQFQNEETIFIGADRGTLHLLKAGIVPIEAVGDFDSITCEEYEEIRSNVHNIDAYQAEKNETDLELAVDRALVYQPTEVILVGVTGGRLDHMLSALHLLYRLKKEHPAVSFKIRNDCNEMTMFLPGEHTILLDDTFQYISFFSFGEPVTALTLQGFKYETYEESLAMGVTKFTSNELLQKEGHISFREGICLMVRSSDA